MPAENTPTPSESIDSSFSFDDLIPDDLKEAFAKSEDNIRDFPDVPKDPNPAPRPAQRVAASQMPDIEPVREEEIEQEVTPVQEEPIEDDKDEDIDLSDESINKFLEGDIDAVSKKASKKDLDEEESFPWYENEHYKKLLQKASYAGVSQKELDQIIQDASDTKVINNSKYIQGLESKTNEYTAKLDRQEKEIQRLRQIEKGHMFDSLPETQEKFTKPIQADISNMRKILDMEGVPSYLPKLLNAANKAEFTEILRDSELADSDLTRLTNYWRSYRENVFNYNNAKQEALKTGQGLLKHNIDDSQAETLLKNNIIDFLKSDKKYKYIEEGIQKGVQNNQEVSDFLATARNNFVALTKALANPTDFVHDDKQMNALARYVLESAHNMNIEKKYYDAQERLKNSEEKLLKVVKAYKKLAKSGNGISESRRGVYVAKNTDKSNDTKELDAFKAFLKDDAKLEDILKF